MRYSGIVAAIFCLGFGLGLGGCPTIPQSPRGDAGDAGDGEEVFVPLSLDRVVESIGEAEGGDRVTIFGAGITSGAVVTFGGEKGTSVLVLDAESLNVTTPPHTPGLVDVTVTLPDGQRQELGAAFLYKSPLELDAIAPAVATTGGGGEVVVTGAGFVASTQILIGGRMLEDAELINDTTIRGRVPPRLRERPGFVDVIASSGFEQRVLEHSFEYKGILELAGLDPVSGASAGGTLVTLRGNALSLAMGVWFGETPGEVVSAEADGHFAVVRTPPGVHGVVDVRAVLDGVTGTLGKAWSYVDPAVVGGGVVGGAALWAGHTSPATGPVSGGQLVAVSVRGLQNGAVDVTFGGVAAPERDRRWGNDGNAQVVVEAPAMQAPGVVPVVVKQGTATAATTFEYVANFVIGSVEPALGPARGLGIVTLKGHGLANASVWIGGKVAARRGSSERDVVVTVPAGSPGRVDIKVEAADGRVLWLPGGYEYLGEARKVWAVDPPEGSQAGGRIERLMGEGFREAADAGPLRVLFGTEPCTDVAVVDDAEIVCRAPRGDIGHVTVDAGGLGQIAMGFGYFDPGTRFGGPAGGPMPEALNVTVLDAQTHDGVPDAFVILWDDLDTPYQGLTDDRGQITFSDIGFGPMQMVTAAKDNYSTASIVEFDARDATLVLIPLIPADPGNGGPGGPVELGDATVAGEVFGGDKYVLTPFGDCAARVGLTASETNLCEPCATDDDCTGEGARCSPLGKQGWRCTSACETDADCASGFKCAGLPNSSVQCVPSPGTRTSRCSTTIPDVFSTIPALGTPAVPMAYQLTTHPGEFAIVCIGGFEDDVSGVFTPTAMGVRRHVFAQPDTLLDGQDVKLDIPLNKTLRIRLDGAPTGKTETLVHSVIVFIDLGSDGVFAMPTQGTGEDQNVFELQGFPEAFADSLYDATYTVYASAASSSLGIEGGSGEGSFVMFQPIAQVFSDAVFELDLSGASEDAVAKRQTGVDVGIHAMAGPHGHGQAPTWLFAAGEAGRVLVWDGTVWGVQQVPTRVALRGVWAAEKNDAWVVGDEAMIAHWDGLRWLTVPGPAALARPDVAWWGVEGDDAGGLWLWGSHGVWRRDRDGVYTNVTGDLTPGSVLGIRAFGPDVAWWVGTGGLIRKWEHGVLTAFDQAGGDLRAVDGSSVDALWVVGDAGRILRWDGRVWFELIAPTLRDLHAVQALGDTDAWAAGDAGVVLHWDGTKWQTQATIEHSDLRGVAETGVGRTFASGLATLVIGPFMQLPSAINPNAATGNLSSLTLAWSLPRGADASFTWVSLIYETGFPFWDIVANGPRTTVPLPDLTAAWGLQPLWPSSSDFVQIVRVFKPGFDMGAWNYQVISPYQWRSWSVRGVPLVIPEP